jgi:hypothetical protein
LEGGPSAEAPATAVAGAGAGADTAAPAGAGAAPATATALSAKEAEARAGSLLLLQLQLVFVWLRQGTVRAFDPTAFVNSCSCLGLEYPVLHQNDAAEFLDKLVAGLEKRVKGMPAVGVRVPCSCFLMWVGSASVYVCAWVYMWVGGCGCMCVCVCACGWGVPFPPLGAAGSCVALLCRLVHPSSPPPPVHDLTLFHGLTLLFLVSLAWTAPVGGRRGCSDRCSGASRLPSPFAAAVPTGRVPWCACATCRLPPPPPSPASPLGARAVPFQQTHRRTGGRPYVHPVTCDPGTFLCPACYH